LRVPKLRRAGRATQTRLYVSRLWWLGRETSRWLQMSAVRSHRWHTPAKLPMSNV